MYDRRITIHRVRCTNSICRKTHAVIPSFSVPCCSIGTKELNQFITMRASGKTVEESGQCFINAGMCPDYPEAIHRRLQRYRSRIETIFSQVVSVSNNYADLILDLTGSSKSPLPKLNQLCYEKRFNPVLFSRINILVLPDNKPNHVFSLNHPFCQPP